jgi:hypothetical protein
MDWIPLAWPQIRTTQHNWEAIRVIEGSEFMADKEELINLINFRRCKGKYWANVYTQTSNSTADWSHVDDSVFSAD